MGRKNKKNDSTGPIALPAAGRVRKSSNSRKRALVLLGVHVLAAAHITHYLLSGRSISPVEPSESMYTLELGQLNAGFVFFCVALLGTLIFGRFFCGWGCHLVALQDACGWLMTRMGIKPRPFRSFVLLLAPFVLALYMFVWPTIRRLWWSGEPFPGFSSHLTTDAFWKTFPGPLFAGLTFAVCGFAAVYFLGAKGFCTYGCPYGAFFAVADRLSPTKIVVSDACQQCGHCTATCTSNVLVHAEVKSHGRVVDPGCMKCMDCVSVCPTQALSVGFALPTLFTPAAAKRWSRRSLSVGEELLVGGTCVGATLAFRGLYDGPPLLMAMGLGGITAFVALTVWRLLGRSTVRIQATTLKAGGDWTGAGRIALAVGVAWLAFGGHSGYVQWHRYAGSQALEQIGVDRDRVLRGDVSLAVLGPEQRDAHARAAGHLSRAARWGLVRTAEVQLGLAWTELIENDVDAAERHVRAALAIDESNPTLHDNLIEMLAARNRPGLLDASRQKLASVESTAREHFELANRLVAAERPEDAIEQYRRSLDEDPGSFPALYNLGGLLRRQGRFDEALSVLDQAAQRKPGDRDVHVERGLVLAALGRRSEAIASFETSIGLAPEHPESRMHLPGLIEKLRGSAASEP